MEDFIQSLRDGWRVLRADAVAEGLDKAIERWERLALMLGPLILILGVLMTSFIAMEPTP